MFVRASIRDETTPKQQRVSECTIMKNVGGGGGTHVEDLRENVYYNNRTQLSNVKLICIRDHLNQPTIL